MNQPVDFTPDQTDLFAADLSPEEKRNDLYIHVFDTKEQLEAEMSRMLEQYDAEKGAGIFY